MISSSIVPFGQQQIYLSPCSSVRKSMDNLLTKWRLTVPQENPLNAEELFDPIERGSTIKNALKDIAGVCVWLKICKGKGGKSQKAEVVVRYLSRAFKVGPTGGS
ncbi:hypothetical protein RF11_12496 [Thelohanellus kitauei]|uniref:Uncharacterized protein n=1 Tax=Thelohanellus kitauei TaxID=669202 RepID=A0A0C2J5X1_THEKT|nr:hypothetical protein RF11_12496 [Thelohanellus kitauei]